MGISLVASTARAVIVAGPSGINNGNTLAGASASLIAAGGPGLGGTPGYDNVGFNSSFGASVTYLGGGWGITARHVSINSTVAFNDGTQRNYNVIQSSITPLHNNDNSLTDLQVFKIEPNTTTGQLPNLPSILPSLISPVAPSGHQFMIGNGEYIDDSLPLPAGQQYWTDDGSALWPLDTTPGVNNPPNDHSGFFIATNHTIRWGDNDVTQVGTFAVNLGLVHGYITQFDSPDYPTANPNPPPRPDEAQATDGDSGGAVFQKVGSDWVLQGIIITINDPLHGQPAGTALYGDVTAIADLTYYRNAILAAVPEPGGFALAGLAGVVLIGWRRLRRR